jgi:hypothetical protein
MFYRKKATTSAISPKVKKQIADMRYNFFHLLGLHSKYTSGKKEMNKSCK